MRTLDWLRAVRFDDSAPFGGIALMGGVLFAPDPNDPRASVLPALAAFGIAAFAFIFNDLQDSVHDRQSPDKAPRPLVSGALRREVAWALAGSFLIGSLVGVALLGSWVALGLSAGLAALGLAYSWRRMPGKTIPGVSSLLHLAGGTGTFLLGAWWITAGDWRAAAVGLFFGLIFAAGHLHQEAQDREADQKVGVLTHAVRYGARPVLWAGFTAWSGACALFSLLATTGAIPPLLGLIHTGAYAVYALGFAWLMGGPLSRERLASLRRLYRFAYLAAGLAMLATAHAWP